MLTVQRDRQGGQGEQPVIPRYHVFPHSLFGREQQENQHQHKAEVVGAQQLRRYGEYACPELENRKARQQRADENMQIARQLVAVGGFLVIQ